MIVKRFHWLFPRECTLETIKASHLASMRLRAGVAGDAIQQRGGAATFGERLPYPVDVLIVPKIGSDDVANRTIKWIKIIEEAKRNGVKVVLDYTDHHLGFRSPMSDFYSKALELADVFVVPSASMQVNLFSVSGRSSVVIPDAVEYDLSVPRARSNVIPMLLWFGHPSNLPFLFSFFKKFNVMDCCELTIVTSSDGLAWVKDNHSVFNLPKCRLVSWSLDVLPKVATESDLALLPVGINDPRKSGASANRLLTALALGLPVLAQSLRSYELFKEYYTDIDNDDIYSVIREPSSQHCKVIAAQNRILTSFLSESIGKEWISLLHSLGKHN